MDKLKLSPANLIIVVSGAVMLIASFLAFYKLDVSSLGGGSYSANAWSSHLFLIATIPVFIGVAMATQVALTTFAPQVKLPDAVLGFNWNQIHLVLGFQATIMMLAFLIQSTGGLDRGIGLFLMVIAALGLLGGAILRTQEQAKTAS